jgi:hypothetical protein
MLKLKTQFLTLDLQILKDFRLEDVLHQPLIVLSSLKSNLKGWLYPQMDNYTTKVTIVVITNINQHHKKCKPNRTMYSCKIQQTFALTCAVVNNLNGHLCELMSPH